MKMMVAELKTAPSANNVARSVKNGVSFVYVAQVVLTQIAFKAKSGNGRIIKYAIECKSISIFDPSRIF